jgi:large subunit ribosomal protein L44
LTRTPTHLLQLPSSTFSSERGDIFQDVAEGAYTAGPLGEAEILYASSGNSHFIAPRGGGDLVRHRDTRKDADI